MPKALDLIGKQFTRLTVIKKLPTNKHGQTVWECKCLCLSGKIVAIPGYCLMSGNSRSCGCLVAEGNKLKNIRHGKQGTPIYNVWVSLKQRCRNKNRTDYHNYGQRGIDYCERWEIFENFYEDMGRGYESGKQLDRIDNNQGYSKENCRWASPKENSNNRRTCVLETVDGETHNLTQWAEILGITSSKLTYLRSKNNNFSDVINQIKNGN